MQTKRSKLLLVIAAFLVGVLIVDAASAARGGRSGGGHRGGGSGHGHHHHHHRFIGGTGIFVGAGYFGGYYPGYYAGYYPSYAYAGPPPASYYIERGDVDGASQDWFFCPGANAYFPAVVECPSGWQRVPAQP